jgi:ElaA protein
MEWSCKRFEELTTAELYDILKLRSEVFIVEQNCVYLDPDGKDVEAWHLIGKEGGKPIAYTRILAPGVSYPEPAIGRVVTASTKRGGGLGRELMEKSIEQCEKLFGKKSITISAQVYLKKFYESLGFIAFGEEFIDDGIMHINMTRNSPA